MFLLKCKKQKIKELLPLSKEFHQIYFKNNHCLNNNLSILCTCDSACLENNSYDENETHNLINNGMTTNKSLNDAIMLTNLHQSFCLIEKSINDKEGLLLEDLIKQHYELLNSGYVSLGIENSKEIKRNKKK